MLATTKEILNYCSPHEEQIEQVTWEPLDPRISIRVATKEDTLFIKISKEKLPLYLNQKTVFKVKTSRRFISLTLNPFNYDGATYPEWLKPLLGAGISKEYRLASAIHDYLMSNKKYVYDEVLKRSLTISEFRRITSLIFRQVLIETKVNKIKAYTMAFFVHLWQTLACRKSWDFK